jgi:transcriptional regulator with XRE-family HTH domain
VNDAQVGSIFRAIRIRRGLTQTELAAAAGVSQSTVSSIECGQLGGVALPLTRRVAATLTVSITVEARWRGGETARLLDERHAALVQAAAATLTAAGWVVWPEKTFSVYGERGSIDVLGWHPSSRAAIAIEAKTRIPDLQDLLSTMDRKRRLLPAISRAERWTPVAFASVLVVADQTWARNQVRRYSGLFDSALPARTVEVRNWLARPVGDLRGVWFLLDTRVGGAQRKPGGAMRVSTHRGGR